MDIKQVSHCFLAVKKQSVSLILLLRYFSMELLANAQNILSVL